MRVTDLSGGGPSAPDAVLGSATPFFSVKGQELKKPPNGTCLCLMAGSSDRLSWL